MQEIINRDRFLAWLQHVSDVGLLYVDWDALGATYISVGLWLVIVAICTNQEVKRI